jgi:hypothetical protein
MHMVYIIIIIIIIVIIIILKCYFTHNSRIWGRTMTQAVSRRLPTAAASVTSQFKKSGLYGGQSGTAASFLRVLQVFLLILIAPTAPHSSIL